MYGYIGYISTDICLCPLSNMSEKSNCEMKKINLKLSVHATKPVRKFVSIILAIIISWYYLSNLGKIQINFFGIVNSSI